jgi:hypothetical protein
MIYPRRARPFNETRDDFQGPRVTMHRLPSKIERVTPYLPPRASFATQTQLDYTPSDVEVARQILAATEPQTPQRAVYSPFVPGPAAAATPEPAAGTPGPEPAAGTPGPEPAAGTPGPEPAAEPYKPETTSREKRSVPVAERLANYADLLDGMVWYGAPSTPRQRVPVTEGGGFIQHSMVPHKSSMPSE